MKQIRAYIPEPCHENWELMSETEKGRHCEKCCKTVVDFRNVPDDELQQQFASFVRERNDVCGRFRSDQLDLSPEEEAMEIRYKEHNWTIWQKFLIAFVFAFILGGFSACKVHDIQGGLLLDRSQLLQVDHELDEFDAQCGRLGTNVTQGSIVFPPPVVLKKDSLKKDTLRNTLVHKMFFDTDSASLNDQSQRALKELADTLKKYRDYSVEIIGHTDSTGTELHNKKLSIDRANAVAGYLRAQGTQVDIVRGVGYQFPIAPNSDENGRALNRRVEVIVTKQKQPPKK